MMYRVRNRGLSVLLSVALAASMVPAPALAAAEDELAPGGAAATVDQQAAADGEAQAPQDGQDALVLDAGKRDAGQAAEVATDDGAAPADAAVDVVADQKADAPADTSNPADLDATLAAQDGAQEINDMQLDVRYEAYLEDGGAWVGRFTAPEAGTYVFESEDLDEGSSADTYGSLFADEDLENNLEDDDDSGEGRHFRIARSLTQGQTVYLKASGYGSEAADFAVSVSKPDMSDLSRGTLRLTGSQTLIQGQSLDLLGVAVSDVYGGKLVAGTDYELVYYRYYDETLLSAPPTEVGEYCVAAKGIGAYKGETSKEGFSISTRDDLGHAELDMSVRSFASTSMPDSLSAYVKVHAVGGEVLTEGTHYTLRYAPYVTQGDDEDPYCHDEDATTTAPKTPGEYGVQAVAIDGGGYTGSSVWWIYNVWDSSDINGYYHNFYPSDEVDITVEGASLPTSVLYRYGSDDDIDEEAPIRLVEGTDYRLVRIEDRYGETISTGSLPTEPGYYVAVYEGMGSYRGFRYADFTVVDGKDIGNDSDLSGFDLSLKTSVFGYTGQAIEPEVRLVAADGTWLDEGTDYRLAGYRDETGAVVEGTPSEIGSYQLVFEGMGAWYGTRDASVSIVGVYDLAHATIQLEDYDIQIPEGQSVQPQAMVTDVLGGKVPASAYELVYYNEEGAPLSGAPSTQGDYNVAARAIAGSGYTGETDMVWFWAFKPSGSGDDEHVLAGTGTLTLDESTAISLERNEYWLGTFVAPEAGYYAFASAGGGDDTYGELYADADLQSRLSYNDDSGENGHFRITHKLNQGETVYLLARGYAWEAAACNVFVTRFDENDLANGSLSVQYSHAWTGEPLDVAVEVYSYEDEKLVKNTHYTLEIERAVDSEESTFVPVEAPVELGYYRVRAVAKDGSGYSGATDWERFRVSDTSALSDGSFGLQTRYYAYTGKTIEPTTTLKDAAGRVVEAYELIYLVLRDGISTALDGKPLEIGNYLVSAQAKAGSGYTGHTYWQSFSIYDPYDLDRWGDADLLDYDFRENGVKTYHWTGTPVRPKLSVYVYVPDDDEGGIHKLTEGTDYTVTYAHDNEASTYGQTATATITGMGPYHGRIVVHYGLSRTVSLESYVEEHGVKLAYDGRQCTTSGFGAPTFALNTAATPTIAFESQNGAYPVADKDYTLAILDADGNPATPNAIGTYTVRLTGKGDYTGTAKVHFKLVDRKALNDSGIKSEIDWDWEWRYIDAIGFERRIIEGTPAQVDAMCQAWSLSDYDQALVAGTDYTVRAEVAGDKKSVTFVITGMGSYTGELSTVFYFDESKASIAGAVVEVAGVTYTGAAQTPAPKVTLGGHVLAAGTDYDVAYRDNTNAGTATVIVTGRGGYTGTARGSFTIARASIKGAKISGLKTKTYTGKAIKQTPKVTLDGKTLVAGTDYSVSYKNNKNAGRATVTVTGKGNYTGKATATFTISKAKNTMKAKAKKPLVKAGDVAKKARTVGASKAFSVTKAQGKLTYKKVSGSKALTIAKNGKVTVKKGTKKGTYKINVQIQAEGTKNYKALTKKVTLAVRVK